MVKSRALGAIRAKNAKDEGEGVPRGVQGGSRGFWAEKAKNTKQPEKRSGTVWLAYYAATSRILCRRFQ